MLSYTQFFLGFFGDLLLWKKPILEVKQNNTKETNPHAEDNKQSRSRTRIIEDEIYETLKEKEGEFSNIKDHQHLLDIIPVYHNMQN